MTDEKVRGVGLGDLYRDKAGRLWEVISLCTEPTATVREVGTSSHTETHVIGCLNWQSKWAVRYIEDKP
jgi:hypothetical protein